MADNKVMVSVCVQTYNQEKYISQCMEGIISQKTNFDLEVIIGEDGSIDGTSEICVEYAKNYPGIIRLIKRSRNDVIFISGRPSGRYNFIENLKAARGKYIAICEGDDYWTDPLKLQKQVDFLEAHDDFNICFHPVQLFNQETEAFIEDFITPETQPVTLATDLAAGNYIHTPSVMLRNNFSIPEWFKLSPIGDWTLYMIAVKDKKIKKLKDSMAVYRLHNASLWSNRSQPERERQTIKSVELVYRNVPDLPDDVKTVLKNRIDKYGKMTHPFFRFKKRLRQRLITIKKFFSSS